MIFWLQNFFSSKFLTLHQTFMNHLDHRFLESVLWINMTSELRRASETCCGTLYVPLSWRTWFLYPRKWRGWREKFHRRMCLSWHIMHQLMEQDKKEEKTAIFEDQMFWLTFEFFSIPKLSHNTIRLQWPLEKFLWGFE